MNTSSTSAHQEILDPARRPRPPGRAQTTAIRLAKSLTEIEVTPRSETSPPSRVLGHPQQGGQSERPRQNALLNTLTLDFASA